jgi:hypothetical protein
MCLALHGDQHYFIDDTHLLNASHIACLHCICSHYCRHFLNPILVAREPDATPAQKAKALKCQNEMSTVVNEFILRRTNTLNAKHLPPKLVQVHT